jgi:hypothetical protein
MVFLHLDIDFWHCNLTLDCNLDVFQPGRRPNRVNEMYTGSIQLNVVLRLLCV